MAAEGPERLRMIMAAGENVQVGARAQARKVRKIGAALPRQRTLTGGSGSAGAWGEIGSTGLGPAYLSDAEAAEIVRQVDAEARADNRRRQDPGPALFRLAGAALELEDLEREVRREVGESRACGASWADVAQRLGVTRQSAQRRFGGSGADPG